MDPGSKWSVAGTFLKSTIIESPDQQSVLFIIGGLLADKLSLSSAVLKLATDDLRQPRRCSCAAPQFVSLIIDSVGGVGHLRRLVATVDSYAGCALTIRTI